MKRLNQKLEEFAEKPRTLSEPKLRYIPTADLRPEAIEAMEPQARWLLQKQLQEGTYVDKDAYQLDDREYQTEKELLINFLTYRRKFEHR